MNKSPTKAIRLKCMDCTCQQANEVRDCTITDCPLYPSRFGKNPYHKGVSEKTLNRVFPEGQ